MNKYESDKLPFKTLKETYPEHYQTPEDFYSKDDPWRHARKENTPPKEKPGNQPDLEAKKKARIQELKAELDQLEGGS